MDRRRYLKLALALHLPGKWTARYGSRWSADRPRATVRNAKYMLASVIVAAVAAIASAASAHYNIIAVDGVPTKQ
jgi:hypothetical protein